MTYNEFLDGFILNLAQVFSWIKRNLFPITPTGRSFYSNHLIFTIIGLGLIVTVIEEIAGILSSFRFGGLIFRHFKILYPRSFQVLESPDYTKEKVVRPYRLLFDQKYNGKYFIRYNGRYYPFRVNRFNPFSVMAFRSQLKAGNLISYNELYKGSRVEDYRGSFIQGIIKDARHYDVKKEREKKKSESKNRNKK